MEINKNELRMYSMVGERKTFGLAIDKFAPEMDKLFVMSGDLKSSSGLDNFTKNHPDKYLSPGIAEQNMVGIASGLSTEGYVPFITSFSPFITGRCYDQIRMNLGEMHHNVKLIGLAAGVGVGMQGNSHFGLDDVALMRAVPGMTIITPADGLEVIKAVEAIYKFEGPVYLRLIGEGNTPIINEDEYEFTIGKAITLREGEDIALIASGTMVHVMLKVAELFAEEGISCKVINMHTVKPLDVTAVKKCMKCKIVVTAEEANVIGGLSSAVAEVLSQEGNAPKQMMFGIHDCFPKAGSYPNMMEELGLTPEAIYKSIKTQLNY
ncbi:MAG: transketolase [Bacteroidaceae bacterium]|nr:transketolase [Bacteroidaceae bacterium]